MPVRPWIILGSTLVGLILIGARLWTTEPAPERTPPDTELFLPEDLEVTLWAESPMLHNPTNLDVDAKGRVWVAEAVNYRDFNNKNLPLQDQGDRIVILEDTDGDGTADASKVFVQDPDLRAPLGLAVIGNQVIVSSSPSLIVYTDDDGDDRPDRKEVLLTGFGGYDHDHSLHALLAGPDGRWYFNVGNAGPHIVTDRAGWTLRSGSLYRGGSPYNMDNVPGLVSDDGRRWVGGLALRMAPDGTDLAVLGHNFRNAYELTVDSFGNLWQNDNDDEVMTCRTSWLPEGGSMGYFSTDGTRYWQVDRRPGQDVFTAQWHQEDPGVMPAGDRVGAGAPTGIVRYEGDALGPSYRGKLFSADAGRNVVFQYDPQPQGAGYDLPRSNLITSVRETTEGYVWNDEAHLDDQRKWFRPSDVAVGTDGSIYVADWYDAFVGGHRAVDSTAYGRIYRITPKGKQLTPLRLDLSTTAGQLAALLNPAVNVRTLGFERLRAQGTAVLNDVKAVLEAENPYHRARAVWLMAHLGDAGVATVETLLDNPDPNLRMTAFRALRQAQDEVSAYARKLARDASPAVRREVALALRDAPLDDSRDLFLDLAEGYDGADRWYLEAFGLAAEGKEEALYPLLKNRLGGPPDTWTPRFAGLAWRLHPVAALDDLQQRAAAPQVSAEARTQALVALGFIDDPRAAQAMADLTQSTLPDVAVQAAWWMQYRMSNAWHAYTVTGWQPPTPPEGDLDRVETLLATAQDADLLIDVRIDAAMEMASDPLGGRVLMGLFRQGGWYTRFNNNAAWQLNGAIRGTLPNNPDPMVAFFARKYAHTPRRDAPFSVRDIASLEAVAERGRMAFAVHCAVCHRAGPMGNDVGPDLTQIKAKFDAGGLLDAIIHPDAMVAHNYEAWLITDKDGVATYGFILSDGETVVTKDAVGRRHVFDADEIATRTPLSGSLMPVPEALGLTEQDLADLAAFLLTLE